MTQQLFAGRADMVDDAGASSRRAALVVHAMHEDDRHWIVAQLPAEEGVALERLLKELQTLGIPADAELLHGAVTGSQDVVLEPALRTLDVTSAEALLGRASGSALAGVLVAEPPELVARLLALQDWPFEQALLESMDEGRRRAVHAHRMRATGCVKLDVQEAGVAAAGRRFDETLIDLLNARLAQLPRDSKTADGQRGGVVHPWWTRLPISRAWRARTSSNQKAAR